MAVDLVWVLAVEVVLVKYLCFLKGKKYFHYFSVRNQVEQGRWRIHLLFAARSGGGIFACRLKYEKLIWIVVVCWCYFLSRILNLI